MSVTIRSVSSTDPIPQNGYRISPVPRRFTDWANVRGINRDNEGDPNPRSSRNLFCDINNPDTNYATYFNADDIDSSAYFRADFRFLRKEKHYQHLKDLNAGRAIGLNRYNDRCVTYEQACDLIEALSAQLGLTNREQYRARCHFVSLDREKLGLELELVAYCVCAYVIEQNERNDTRRGHPNVPDDRHDDRLQEIADSLNLRQRDLVKTYGKIQHRTGGAVPPVQHDRRDPDHYPEGGI